MRMKIDAVISQRNYVMPMGPNNVTSTYIGSGEAVLKINTGIMFTPVQFGEWMNCGIII